MWRQFLESLCHEENAFVTLTYNDENLPAGGNLRPSDLSEWIKRFRFRLHPQRVRFFAVGEYGEESLRPHYHVSLFGVSGRTDIVSANNTRHFGCSQAVADTWKFGMIKVAEFNELTAQYVAGYVVKKMTAADDPRLKGLVPEFSRQSNRPGIGANAMPIIAAQLLKSGNNWLLSGEGDVPRELKLGTRRIPLGRYLLRKLREEVGFDEEKIKKIKDTISYEKSKEMQSLYGAALDVSPLATAKSVYLDSTEQLRRNAVGRSKLWSKKGSI